MSHLSRKPRQVQTEIPNYTRELLTAFVTINGPYVLHENYVINCRLDEFCYVKSIRTKHLLNVRRKNIIWPQ